MKRYIIFLIFALASFATLLILGAYQNYVADILAEMYWLGKNTMPMLFWIPYTLIAVSGMFLGGAAFVKGQNKKEELVLAVMSLILAIAVLAFTVLVMKMFLRLPSSFISARSWSDGGARPSMVLAGVLFANAVRHFIDAKKYNE